MPSAEPYAALFHDLLAADSVETGSGVRTFRVDGQTPQCVLFPRSVDELCRCIRAADDAGLAIIPVGNGTQLGIGRPPRRYDIALSTRRLRRLVAHEAADMTATVEAGLTLGDLNAALAAAGQWLPLDPPHAEHGTIGALIAADASGPLRLSQGKVRDLLIGITVVLADGTLVHGGGRVVKNVAGYDVMKLFTGSFGTLGLIVEATFKIRPRPAHEAIFILPAASTEAAVRCAMDVLSAPVAPLYIEALNQVVASGLGADQNGAAVVVGCGGSEQEVEGQRESLGRQFGGVRPLSGAESERLIAALRNFPAEGQGEGAYGCKLSVLPSRLSDLLARVESEATRHGLEAAVLSHVGSGVACVRFEADAIADEAFCRFAESLRAAVSGAGGWVVFDALPIGLKDRIDPWGDIPAMALMRGVKNTLDPHGRLSPGRFVGGI